MFELKEKTEAELREMGKNLEIDIPPNIKRENLEDRIERAMIERKLRLESEARAKLEREAKIKLGISDKGHKPSPETLKIEESKKKYYRFTNLEEEGVNVTLRKGEKHRFNLFDGRVHILPEWLVRNLRRTAVAPVFQDREDPVTKRMRSVQTGVRPRFSFEELDTAPDDAEFGVVLDDSVLNRLLREEVAV